MLGLNMAPLAVDYLCHLSLKFGGELVNLRSVAALNQQGARSMVWRRWLERMGLDNRNMRVLPWCYQDEEGAQHGHHVTEAV